YIKHANNPVFEPPQVGAETIWDRGFVNSPMFCLNKDGTIYKDDDGYAYMYYSATSKVAYGTTHPATPTFNDDRVGLAKTKDFINFERVTGLSENGDGCVMTWGNGDRGDGVGHYGGTPTNNEGFGYRQGQHDGGNGQATIMTDSGASWTVNQFVGLYIVNRTDRSWGSIEIGLATKALVETKFLVKFTEPRKFINYPWDISIIYPDIMTNTPVLKEIAVDINDNESDDYWNPLDTDEINYINRLILQKTIESTDAFFDLSMLMCGDELLLNR
ncbi:unnamed protein product, partial [marine sediment metagenome]